MLFMETKISVIDNSGVFLVKCIKNLKCRPRTAIRIGQKIVVSLKKVLPIKKLLFKKSVYFGIIVQTKYPIKRLDGRYISFFKNAAILLSEKGDFFGTRFVQPFAKEFNLYYTNLLGKAKYLL